MLTYYVNLILDIGFVKIAEAALNKSSISVYGFRFLVDIKILFLRIKRLQYIVVKQMARKLLEMVAYLHSITY